ncbi:hypothetical protein DE4576_05353 [Mycobacterium marinum]|nr:hypothetical protein DE4576_05353 [Mycobacterium marinum]
MRRSVEMTKLSGQLIAASEDGQVAAIRLLNHGQGDLADVISTAWTKYFVTVGLVGAQVGQAGACLSAWANALGAMLAEMSGVVDWAESAIAALEASRPAVEAAGQDVDQLIEQIKTEAQSQIAAISSAAMGVLAAVPSWAASIPVSMSIPRSGIQGPCPATTTGTDGTPTGGVTGPGQGAPPGRSAGGVIGPGQAGSPAPLSNTGGVKGPGSGGDPAPGQAGSVTGPGQASTAPAALNSGPAGGVLGPASGTSSSAPNAGGVSGGSVSGSSGASTSASPPVQAPSTATPTSGTPSTTTGHSNSGSGAGTEPSASATPPDAQLISQSSAAATAPQGLAAARAVAVVSAACGAEVAPVAGSALGPAAASAPLSAAPLSALASAPAAAGAVPAPSPGPPSPPVSPLSPAASGNAVAPPSVAGAQPAAGTGVRATTAAGPAPAPGSVAPTHAAAPSSRPVSNWSPHDRDPLSPPAAGVAGDGATGPIISPLTGGCDPLVVPAVLIPPTSSSAALGDQDLATVRSVVEAAGGASQVHWAAGMVVTSGRRQVVLTSDRGRSWVPAEAFLPADVITPWSHEQSSCWGGLLDPARVIVEYAAAAGGRLTALASTFSGAPAVAAGIPWTLVDGTDRAHPELLSGPVVTRFELQVSPERRRAVKHITDPVKQRVQVLWLALSADETAGSSGTRGRMLSLFRDHLGRIDRPRWVASLPWEQLEEEHHRLCVQERAARLDVRNTPVGQLDTGGGACQPLLAQAYATEAALALRNPVALRALTDATYSWSMLINTQFAGPGSSATQFVGR